MSVGYPAWYYLELFGEQLRYAFDGVVPYHVGSSLMKKRGWRDVDVVLILDDEKWAALGYGPPDNRNAKCEIICAAFSELGFKMTGLPIDFKIQQSTYANKEFPGSRSALGISLALARDECNKP